MASLAILVLAYETDMSVQLVQMDIATKRMEDGRPLSEINPKNCMPVLERDDGSILTETAVILEWLAAQDPQLRFTAPAHSEEHLRINEWMVYFATEQHKLATLLFWDIPEDSKKAIRDRIVHRFGIAEKALAKADFLVGNRCTIADFYLLVMVRGVEHLFEGFDLSSQFPAIHVWMKRLIARPAVIRALQNHGQGELLH